MIDDFVRGWNAEFTAVGNLPEIAGHIAGFTAIIAMALCGFVAGSLLTVGAVLLFEAGKETIVRRWGERRRNGTNSNKE